jgi:predicted nucleic acid-binding protein
VTVFVDTSAFYAILDKADSNHDRAGAFWERLLRGSATLITTNYILLETSALLQHRLGLAALRGFHEDVAPLLEVTWISELRHQGGLGAVLMAGRKKLSLVDCVSFQTMRETDVRTAFCFDNHFKEQGFTVVP